MRKEVDHSGMGLVAALGYELELSLLLKPAMRCAWPIIVFFVSVIGISLYLATARPPGIGRINGNDEKQNALDQYEQSSWRRVNGAVIHCVAGDGLGIMTAMAFRGEFFSMLTVTGGMAGQSVCNDLEVTLSCWILRSGRLTILVQTSADGSIL
jgi:hypothetical protein